MGSFDITVLDVGRHWSAEVEDAWSSVAGNDQTASTLDTNWYFSQVVPPVEASTEEIIAAHDIVFAADIASDFPEQVAFTEESVSVTMDISWYFQEVEVVTTIEVLVATDIDHHGDYYSEHWARGPPEEHNYGSDVTNDSTVAALFPPQPVTEPGTVNLVLTDIGRHWPELEPHPADDSTLDALPVLLAAAETQVNVSDTLNVAVDETAQVEQVESIEQLIAASYSTFQGTEEALQSEVKTVEDFYLPTGVDVSGQIVADRFVDVIDTLNVVIDDQAFLDTGEFETVVIANYSTPERAPEEYLAPPALTVEDYSSSVVLATDFIFATREINVTDTLGVAVVDTAALQQFSEVAELVAAHYTTFYGTVEAQTAPTWDEYQSTTALDITFLFAGAFVETIEALVAANYSDFQGDVEWIDIPVKTTEDFSTATVVDTSFILATRDVNVADTLDVEVADSGAVQVLGGIEDMIAANYSTFQGSVEPLEAAGLTVENFSNQVVADVTFLIAAVSINVSDTLNIAVDDASALEVTEGIVGLVSANYSAFYGTVEALQPEVLTVENNSSPAVHDVSYILAAVNVNVVDTLDVAVDDVSSLQAFETIEGLVAANYSTFFGTVEALFPPQTTIEGNSSYSTEVPIVNVPTPPQPWGPFTAVVDDYTWIGVVEEHEAVTEDDSYQPIEPEEGG